jgi:signal transduction histidine kinase
MTFDFIKAIEICFTYRSEAPLNLIYYSHLSTASISIIIGLFVFLKDYKSLLNRLLFILSLCFSVWVIFDFIIWNWGYNSVLTMISWSLLSIFIGLISILSYYFFYVFLLKRDLSYIKKILIFIPLIPILLITPTIYNLPYFDMVNCEASENMYFNYYFFGMGAIAIIGIILLFITNFSKIEKTFRKEATLMFVGLELFLISFLSLGLISSYYDNYSIEFYGLFGMVIFMAFLAYLIVKFKAFDIKLIGAQALVWALIILVGSQFFYQADMPQSSLILTAVTLLVSAIVGLFIVRSVKKEVALRESLEIANQNQTALIHFISHQLKGFFTKSKMVFSGILEGDFGEANSTIKDMAKTGLDSDNNAVAMIQDILGASNLKTGTTNFNFKNIVLNDVIKKVCGIFKEEMSKKGLQFETDITDKPLTASVDETQITQVFKNLIDNSLRYTPTGKIIVSLMPNSDGKKAVFEVSDTGVGLSDNDKLKLFTEGGKGEESLKINTNSTGYGLYIVKKIVTSHNGNVWAESAGRGHGSQFYVELPTIAQSSV